LGAQRPARPSIIGRTGGWSKAIVANEWCLVLCALCLVLCALCLGVGAWACGHVAALPGSRVARLARKSCCLLSGITRGLGQSDSQIRVAPPSGVGPTAAGGRYNEHGLQATRAPRQVFV